MVTKEEIDAAVRLSFEIWQLTDPDATETYHAFRLMKLREDKPVATFDDFKLAWVRHVGR